MATTETEAKVKIDLSKSTPLVKVAGACLPEIPGMGKTEATQDAKLNQMSDSLNVVFAKYAHLFASPKAWESYLATTPEAQREPMKREFKNALKLDPALKLSIQPIYKSDHYFGLFELNKEIASVTLVGPEHNAEPRKSKLGNRAYTDGYVTFTKEPSGQFKAFVVNPCGSKTPEF